MLNREYHAAYGAATAQNMIGMSPCRRVGGGMGARLMPAIPIRGVEEIRKTEWRSPNWDTMSTWRRLDQRWRNVAQTDAENCGRNHSCRVGDFPTCKRRPNPNRK